MFIEIFSKIFQLSWSLVQFSLAYSHFNRCYHCFVDVWLSINEQNSHLNVTKNFMEVYEAKRGAMKAKDKVNVQGMDMWGVCGLMFHVKFHFVWTLYRDWNVLKPHIRRVKN